MHIRRKRAKDLPTAIRSAGMVRKSSGNLHFYINGLDQGVAATRVPQQMWGVVDLYGMTVKVS